MATERYHMLLDWRGEHNITFAAPGQQIGKARPLLAMLSTTPYCLKFTQSWGLRALPQRRGHSVSKKKRAYQLKLVCPSGQLLFSDQRKEEKALWKDC